MEIESLHKYISLNKQANGNVEVLFAGQPCLYIKESDSPVWVINPIFAKLVYGANIFEDIPVCSEVFSSTEEAIAGGLVALHDLGAFNTEVDLPEDSYAATMNQVSESVKTYSIKNNQNLIESATAYTKIMRTINEGTYKIGKPFVAESDYMSKVAAIVEYAKTNPFNLVKEGMSDDEIQAAHEKWKSDVKAAHPDKKLKFRNRIEKGVHTTSAEISDKDDKSYGVWDHDENVGHIFKESIEPIGELIQERSLTDSEKEKREEIVMALKKDKKFMSKYGKDSAYAIATAKAMES